MESGHQVDEFTGVRSIVFDAVGTLIYPDPPAAKVYAEIAQRFGSRQSTAEVEKRFRAAFLRQEQADQLGDLCRRATSEERERRRWQTIVAEVFEDIADADQSLFNALWDHFAQPGHWSVYEDAIGLWSELEQLGYDLAIASNFDCRLMRICTSCEPLSRCSRVYWSAEIGYPKPSAEFFRTVEQRLNATPAEILFVGDSRVNDYEGGRAAGWNTFLLQRDARAPAPPDLQNRVLHELGQLRGLLSRRK